MDAVNSVFDITVILDGNLGDGSNCVIVKSHPGRHSRLFAFKGVADF